MTNKSHPSFGSARAAFFYQSLDCPQAMGTGNYTKKTSQNSGKVMMIEALNPKAIFYLELVNVELVEKKSGLVLLGLVRDFRDAGIRSPELRHLNIVDFILDEVHENCAFKDPTYSVYFLAGLSPEETEYLRLRIRAVEEAEKIQESMLVLRGKKKTPRAVDKPNFGTRTQTEFKKISTGMVPYAAPSNDSTSESEKIKGIFSSHGLNISVKSSACGPTVSTFEIIPAPGTKISKIQGLETEMCVGLGRQVRFSLESGRLMAEVQNDVRSTVSASEMSSDLVSIGSKMDIPLLFGKDASGNPVIRDLAKMPHVLVAGTTGSGKSVLLSSIISGIAAVKSPEEVRFIFIDPKKVELTKFESLPHNSSPVITDCGTAVQVLNQLVKEMERRFTIFSKRGVTDINGYNAVGGNLSRIVVICDELADLMLQDKKAVEPVLVRLAQKSRAAGIHLILCTQRPSVDVVTGILKANMPVRVALRCAQAVDSRVILDRDGAEDLLGMGDTLVMQDGNVLRVQAPFVSDGEIRNLVSSFKKTA